MTKPIKIAVSVDWLLPIAAQQLRYDGSSGEFYWQHCPSKSKKWNTRWAGKRAGNTNRYGYIRIGVTHEGKEHSVLAHRLAFYIAHGRPPNPGMEIDHINGLRADNRLTNLREVTRSYNNRNQKLGSLNTSGAIGVMWSKQKNKWHAVAKVHKVLHHIGYFREFDRAVSAVTTWRLANGFTGRHGEQV